MIEFLSGGGSGADTVINIATVEVRFGAVVLIEKLVFNVAYEKIGVAGSHFGAHGAATPLICLRGRTGPVTEILVFTTEISVTRMKIFPYEHSSPVTGIASLSQHSGKNGIILVLYVFPLQEYAK